tara:strand:+ start:13807 stop:14208 length:402 start_codon:yes stop_codon:yes gene_type:complete
MMKKSTIKDLIKQTEIIVTTLKEREETYHQSAVRRAREKVADDIRKERSSGDMVVILKNHPGFQDVKGESGTKGTMAQRVSTTTPYEQVIKHLEDERFPAFSMGTSWNEYFDRYKVVDGPEGRTHINFMGRKI